MRTEAINTALLRRRDSRTRTIGERLAELASQGELSRRILVATPLLAIGFAVAAFGGVYGWAYGIAYLIVYASLLAWLVQVWRGRLAMRGRRIYLAMLAIGAYTTGAYVFHFTRVPGTTLTAIMQLAPAALIFVLLTQVVRPEVDAGWIAPAMAGFTAALGLLAIAQLFTSSNSIYWHFRYTFASPAGPYVNRNHFAGCMEMLIPVALWQVWRQRANPLGFLAWSVPPILGLGALLLSASRGGAVAMAVEGFAGLLALLLLRRQPELDSTATSAIAVADQPSRSHRRRTRTTELERTWLALAIGFTLLTAMVALVGTQRLQDRFASYTMTPAQSATIARNSVDFGQRSLLNQASLRMWRVHPIAGWGLGTWASVYPHFALFDDGLVYEFAHNDYLEWLTETGLVGSALLIAFWSFWFVTVLRRIRINGPARGMALASLLACLGLLVHSWVDFNLHIPANLLLFLTMAALGIAGTSQWVPDETFTPVQKQKLSRR